MYRSVTILIAAVLVAGITEFADAQGQRPAGAGAQSPTPGPVLQRPGSRGDFGLESRRQQELDPRRQSELRRAEADARRQAAERRRESAAQNNRSEAARSEHAPNEHAADEAFAAEANAGNRDLREERRDLREQNRGDRGRVEQATR